MTTRHLFAAFCLVLLVMPLQCFLQAPKNTFTNFDITDGLTANNCKSLLIDKDGYLVIGTVDGLNKYSGRSFQAPGNGALQTENIRDIIQDKDGSYWLANYEHGLMHINTDKPTLIPETYNITTHNNTTPPTWFIHKIIDDKRGNLWIGTHESGLFVFNKQTKTFKPWKLNSPYSKFALSIRSFFLEENLLYVGIINGLAIIDLNTRKTSFAHGYIYSKNGFDPTVRAIAAWNADTLLAATDRGAYFYLKNQKRFTPVFHLKDSPDLRSQEYNDVIKISSNEIWFGSVNRGLLMINPYTGSYMNLTNLDSKKPGFICRTVNRLIKDSSGNIWVAHINGLSQYRNVSNSFQNYILPSVENIAMSAKFLLTHDDQIISYDLNNLYRWNLKSSGPEQIPNEGFSKLSTASYLFEHKTFGTVVIDGAGPKRVNKDGRLERMRNAENNPKLFAPGNRWGHVTSILVDTINGKETWWIGGDSRHVMQYDPYTGVTRSAVYFPAKDSLSKEYPVAVSKIVKDSTGTIWIATRRVGLYYIADRINPDLKQLPLPLWKPGSFITDNIADLHIDAKRTLWALVPRKGIMRINISPSNRAVSRIYPKNNSTEFPELHRIVEDNMSNLWIGSSNGLFCFNPNTASYREFDYSYGINNQTFDRTADRDTAGNIYLSSSGNLLKFNPAEVLRKPINAATIRLLSLNTDDSAISIDNGKGRFQNVISLLEGYDTKWEPSSSAMSRSFRNLPPGRYSFRVTIPGNGFTAPKELSFPIVVQQFFYTTWWFYWLCILGVVLLSLLAARMYTDRKLAVQRDLLGRKQAVEKERLRISTELHDDLGSTISTIRLMSEMAKHDVVRPEFTYLETISEKSRDLIQSMNEIVWSLNNNNDTLPGLIAYIRSYSAKFMEESGIRFSFEMEGDPENLLIAGPLRRDIFLIVKESLHNAVKHSHCSRVHISVMSGDGLSIKIRDNGIGIGKLTGDTTGNGIRNVKSRAQNSGMSLHYHTSGGTEIFLFLPKNLLQTGQKQSAESAW
ncbi:MAG: hypothetical protein EOO02_05030 [Chitinophagaceae bacterium]|nr:MAG: hypothetical protein EOO02_05030 [Chitinophagaceae bacterium]